ncbi:hypothetical protein BZG36_01156 [Bifiguratus adelaidae]|uniref:ER-bound oxygenase mpaB/mpaB'/Rubber oxygenase catalytic domain-containing protein n=1 Tax=Bifiguratus adelaidae TaxID=1938954 RepID=A0A261Y674_9FUNG|nr:hypothetical protein BZG36_01156 [Bifiguratus adelaidae]
MDWKAGNLWPEVKVGDKVRRWDFEFTWTEHHKPGHVLEPLRQQGDPLADDVVSFLKLNPHQDVYAKVSEYLSTEDAPAVQVLRFMEEMKRVPDWLDPSQIERGQRVFWTYGFPILTLLCHFSLVGGMAHQKVTKILMSTGYFSTARKTHYRLFETTQWILDTMFTPHALDPETGLGWQSIFQVRLLHAQVRQRLKKLAQDIAYDVATDGVPINQEDLISTLCIFSVAMIEGLRRMGVRMSSEEQCDFIAVWRYIGYLMGVDEKIDPLRTVKVGMAWWQSTIMHGLDPLNSNGRSQILASAVIQGLSDQPPMYLSLRHHATMCRVLLGESLCDDLALPKGTRLDRIACWAQIGIMGSLIRGGKVWKALGERRIERSKRIFQKIVTWRLAGKRSKFEFKALPGARPGEEHVVEEWDIDEHGQRIKYTEMKVKRMTMWRYHFAALKPFLVLTAGVAGGALGVITLLLLTSRTFGYVPTLRH